MPASIGPTQGPDTSNGLVAGQLASDLGSRANNLFKGFVDSHDLGLVVQNHYAAGEAVHQFSHKVIFMQHGRQIVHVWSLIGFR